MLRNASPLKEALYTGVAVDIQSFAAAIRRCSETKSLWEGRRLHESLKPHRHDRQRFLGNLLVHMYGSCDRLEEARAVFENIPQKNVFSWNIIITVYAQRGHLEEARLLFERSCNRNVVSWNSLAGFYAQHGLIDEAKAFYAKMPEWDVVSWNLMIAAYTQHGHALDALSLFLAMPERNVITWNALITMHAENHNVPQARAVFEKMPARNSISWSAILTAYTQNSLLDEAQVLFEGIPQLDVCSCTTMIMAFTETGEVHRAKEIFDRIGMQDTLSWSMMISAYAQNGETAAAIHLFRCMDLEGMRPDSITFIAVLEAYGYISCHTQNRVIHEVIESVGLTFHPIVSTSLMNIYGKSGNVVRARELFDELPKKDVVAWNTMLVTYAHNGHCRLAWELFDLMIHEGVFPDHISFISVLSSASHAGVLRTGWEYFVSMVGDYGVAPVFEHFVCMIDLLGRAGKIWDAAELIVVMPFEPDAICWRILLCGCRSIGDEKLGDHAADHAIDIDGEDASPYYLLGHTYAANGKLGGLVMFNRLMMQKPLKLPWM